MPGFSAGMANVSRDEQRHIGFGVKVLSELLAESPSSSASAPRWSSCCAKPCPTASPSSRRPNLDRAYTECYGFTLEDIFAFGLKLIRQRWRTIGFPTEEMPPGVFPFDPEIVRGGDRREPDQAAEGRRRRPARPGRAAILARAAAPLLRHRRPLGRPERRQRLAARLPVALQRRRSLAPGRRQRLDPGRARRGAEPDVTFETTLGRLGASTRPGASPVKSILRGRIRPRGKVREIVRMRKVFPG